MTSRTKPVTSPVSLTDEQRADIEDLVDRGYTPSTIAKELGLPIGLCQRAAHAYRMNTQRQEAKDNPSSSTPSPSVTDEFAKLNTMLAESLKANMLQQQLDNLKETMRHQQEMNRLQEREKKLDLDEREDELAGPDEPLVAPPAPVEAPIGSSNIMEIVNNFEENPLGSLAALGVLFYQMNQNKGVQTTMPPNAIQNPQTKDMPDWSKALSKEQIASFIETVRVERPQTYHDALEVVGTELQHMIVSGLKSTFSNMSDENITLVINRLKEIKAGQANNEAKPKK